MFDRLNGLKNMIWAISIVLCLLALFVGFIFAAVTPYHGESDPRTPDLNAVREQNAGTDVEALNFVEPDGALHALGETKDAGAGYLSSSVFLTDSVMLALREQALTGGDVWSSENGFLSMENIANWGILYSDGSRISPADACMITKPSLLFIAVGSDGLASVTEQDFISGYEALIRGIQAVSPDTKIVCCSVAPVGVNYASLDGLTTSMASQATEWVQQVCTDTGVYYADTASVLRSGIDLNPKYAASNDKTLNTAGLQAVLGYLRSHAVGG